MFAHLFEISSTSTSFLLEKEEYYWMSPLQVNEHLGMVIEAIQKNSKIFASLKRDTYYVVLGEKQFEKSLVLGKKLIDFSVEVLTVELLQKIILNEGVPSDDKYTLSLAIEESYEERLDFVHYSIKQYASTLMRTREIACVKKKKITYLLRKSYENILLEKWRLFMAKNAMLQLVAFGNIVENRKRFNLLAKVLRERV